MNERALTAIVIWLQTLFEDCSTVPFKYGSTFPPTADNFTLLVPKNTSKMAAEYLQ